MVSTTGAVIGMEACSLVIRVKNAALSNVRSGARLIAPAEVMLASTLSPSFRPAARVYATGNRTAKLLPHLDTCSFITHLRYVYPRRYITILQISCQAALFHFSINRAIS